MKRGPKPKPTALKIIAGNPGRRALRDKAAVVANAPMPKPPKELPKEVRAVWNELGPEMARIGTLSKMFTPAFRMLCENIARRRYLEAQINKHGLLVKSPTGYPVMTPYFYASQKVGADVLRLINEFGLTPSSRSRLDVMPIEPEVVAPANTSPDEEAARDEEFFGPQGA
jgi:P27 family predicted phage terminase small subunit